MKLCALFVLFCALAVPHAALASKPFPPPQLSIFFAEVVEMEDAVGEEEWEEALATMRELHEVFEKISPLLKQQVGESLAGDLSAEMETLKVALDSRDKKRVSLSLIKVQETLFSAMDKYLYMIHPVVLIIDQYVGEALEAAERGDFARVAHELEEVEVFIGKAAKVLEQKGAGPGMQKDFRQQLEKSQAASQQSDHAVASIELAKLKKISATFIWMVSQ